MWVISKNNITSWWSKSPLIESDGQRRVYLHLVGGCSCVSSQWMPWPISLSSLHRTRRHWCWGTPPTLSFQHVLPMQPHYLIMNLQSTFGIWCICSIHSIIGAANLLCSSMIFNVLQKKVKFKGMPEQTGSGYGYCWKLNSVESWFFFCTSRNNTPPVYSSLCVVFYHEARCFANKRGFKQARITILHGYGWLCQDWGETSTKFVMYQSYLP